MEPVPGRRESEEHGAVFTYLWVRVPRENFEEKFWTYWHTIWIVLMFGPAVRWLAVVVVGAHNGWALPVLIPGLAVAFFVTGIAVLDLPAPVSKLYERSELVAKIYGRRGEVVYNIFGPMFTACVATWNCTLFFYPPLHEPLAAMAVVLAVNAVSFLGLAGTEISLRNPRWKVLRLSRMLTMGTSFLEFGTDFASGITALNQGNAAVGASIMAIGGLEFVGCCLVLVHGHIAHTPTTFWAHSALEVPLVVLSVLAIVQSGKPLLQQPAHTISLFATLLSFLVTLSWLYCGPTLERKLSEAYSSFRMRIVVHPGSALAQHSSPIASPPSSEDGAVVEEMSERTKEGLVLEDIA